LNTSNIAATGSKKKPSDPDAALIAILNFMADERKVELQTRHEENELRREEMRAFMAVLAVSSFLLMTCFI
jgi:hypothetical protein